MGVYHRFVDSFLRTKTGGWTARNVLNPIDKRLMNWSDGKVSTGLGTEFTENVVLLRCLGAKTGAPRETPLLATPLADGWVLIASATGIEHNPAWYHNLKANPQCTLLLRGRGEVRCRAREVDGEERERAWLAANEQYSGFVDYQSRTRRRIPVMVLSPS